MHELAIISKHKFKFVPSRKSIVCTKTDKALTGLHPVLNSTFWPKYNKTMATKNCPRPRNGPLMQSYLFKDLSNKKKKRKLDENGVYKGRYFGIKIDKQIEVSIKISAKHNLPCKFFYDKLKRKEYRGKVPEAVLKAIDMMHMFTKRFWKAVDGLKWKPVATQVGVGCKKWNVATRLDVLAIDEDGKERVIEVKVGYDGYYYKCTPQLMNYPFQEHADCLYHQHMIQVAITNELYIKTYRKSKAKSSKVGDPIVLRLTASTTYIYYLTDWIKYHVKELLSFKAPLVDLAKK